MTIMSSIQNFRTTRKIEQEKNNAGQAVRTAQFVLPVFAIPVALAFVFMLMALVQPASAEINLTPITEVIDAFVGIIDSILTLVLAIVPIWFVMAILSFIMGIMGAILAMIKFTH